MRMHASAAALAALALAACLFTPEKSARGGGSDTETLTGLVKGAAGAPAARVQVKLVPADYDPSRPDTARIRKAMTDSQGRFTFEKVDTAATWNVIAGDAAAKEWAMAKDLKPGSEIPPISLASAKVFRFSLHSAQYQYRDSGIAYFPGTDIFARCNGITATPVDSVPLGALRFVVASSAGWKHDTTLTSVLDSVDVKADKEKVLCDQY